MKRWAWMLAIPVLISLAGAQVTSSLNSPQNPAQASASQDSGHDADSGERIELLIRDAAQPGNDAKFR